MSSGRVAHERGDCNGDHTCYWCWDEIVEERTANPLPNQEEEVDQEPEEGDDA